MKSSRACLIFAATVFACSLSAVLWSAWNTIASEATAWVPLEERMPLSFGNWRGENIPLGPNESTLEAVGRLNYHDYVYRVYRRGSDEVYVYAMYWRQGDISVREMSGHTPDGCWVSNGARHGKEATQRQLHLLDGTLTAPAEVREFLFPPNDAKVNVAWWHIWGDEIIDRSFARKSVVPMLKEVWVWLVGRQGGYRDQILVRVHSTLPIEEAMKFEPVAEFIKDIPEVLSAKLVEM